jgi:hypothetical protein
MFHSNTELLIDYWRRLRGPDAAPAHAAVDPAGFAALAPRVFVANRHTTGEFEVRLAGEALIDFYGRSLRGLELGNLWRLAHRRRLASLLSATLSASEPLAIAAEAWTADGSNLRLEVLFLPLIGAAGATDRFLGLYQPTSGIWRAPIGELALISAFGVADEMTRSHLRLATLDGRRIA